MINDLGKSRRVRTKYQGRIGPPPEPTEEMRQAGASAGAAPKPRRDLAAQKARIAREGKRPRKMGVMKSGSGVVTFPGVGGPTGGGGVATSNGNGETEKAWWENYWIWAGVAALWWLSRRNRK